ncbi:MAG: FtsW/RodA/SpoVE family cell cycle protein [Moorellales bacterium]
MSSRAEVKLVASASLFVLLIWGLLYLNHETGGRLWRLAALAGGLWAGYGLKRRCWPDADPLILPVIHALNLLGLALLYRLEPSLADRQILWVLVGLAGLAVIGLIPDYRFLLEYKYTGAVLTLALLAATLAVGVEAGGARSWLAVGVLRMQPVEAAKLLMVIFLAGYLEENRELLRANWRPWGSIALPAPQALVPLATIWGLSLLLVAFQRDLGGSLILFCTLVAMLYQATERRLYLAAGGLLLLLGFGTGYVLFDHVQSRIRAWLDPWSQAYGTGYQLVQGWFALAAGGLLGSGVGVGYPHLVPAVTTDYLFAALAEEMGLLGGLGLLALYLVLTWRGFRTALRAQDSAGCLLAGGLSSLLALQTLILLGGVTGMLPLTGVALPYFSYGGSSMVVSYLLAGLLLQVGQRGPSGRGGRNS